MLQILLFSPNFDFTFGIVCTEAKHLYTDRNYPNIHSLYLQIKGEYRIDEASFLVSIVLG
jgi:hypothetical protein